MKIIKASERKREDKGAKIVIAGESGVGKTSLLYTLRERKAYSGLSIEDQDKKTLFMDFEAGDLALEKKGGWQGHTIRPETWQDARHWACYYGGPNPSLGEGPYSQSHYDYVVKEFGDPKSVIDKYDTLFIDSITVAGRLCFRWCRQQDEAQSNGKINKFGAYGLLGSEMMDWLSQLQHIRNKNIIFVGILDSYTDDFNQKVYSLQIEGAKTGRELPGIVDEVITMRINQDDMGNSWREFICQTGNEGGFPAKDRSGLLDVVEPPHLGNLLDKLLEHKGTIEQKFNYSIPNTQQTENREVI